MIDILFLRQQTSTPINDLHPLIKPFLQLSKEKYILPKCGGIIEKGLSIFIFIVFSVLYFFNSEAYLHSITYCLVEFLPHIFNLNENYKKNHTMSLPRHLNGWLDLMIYQK